MLGCGGEGCYRCGGSGLYRPRWLYVHKFAVAGRTYCFHSYTAPTNLVEGFGEDKETYGGKFSEAEWKDLPLPVSGLKKILHHVATDLWRMSHYMGRYYTDAPADAPVGEWYGQEPDDTDAFYGEPVTIEEECPF